MSVPWLSLLNGQRCEYCSPCQSPFLLSLTQQVSDTVLFFTPLTEWNVLSPQEVSSRNPFNSFTWSKRPAMVKRKVRQNKSKDEAKVTTSVDYLVEFQREEGPEILRSNRVSLEVFLYQTFYHFIRHSTLWNVTQWRWKVRWDGIYWEVSNSLLNHVYPKSSHPTYRKPTDPSLGSSVDGTTPETVKQNYKFRVKGVDVLLLLLF